jgi:hypothetical protein
MKKVIVFVFIFILIPKIALAVWWNPTTWKIFKRETPPPQIIQIYSTSTETAQEIERLKQEITELRKEKDIKKDPVVIKTQAAPVQKTNPKPQLKVSTSTNNAVLNFDELVAQYTNLDSQVIDEREKIITERTTAPTESKYLAYLKDLAAREQADLGYLYNIKNWANRPAIESIYSAKLISLKTEFESKKLSYNATINIEREQEKIRTAEESDRKALEEKTTIAQKIKEIKVKISEMDRLDIQLATLPGKEFYPYIQNTLKLDYTPLFFQTISKNVDYLKTTNEIVAKSNPSLSTELKSAISNYRAFLKVELAKLE